MAQTNEEEHGASEPKKPFRPFPNQAPPDPLSRTWLEGMIPTVRTRVGMSAPTQRLELHIFIFPDNGLGLSAMNWWSSGTTWEECGKYKLNPSK